MIDNVPDLAESLVYFSTYIQALMASPSDLIPQVMQSPTYGEYGAIIMRNDVTTLVLSVCLIVAAGIFVAFFWIWNQIKDLVRIMDL
mmetsp:Transcript_18717/g.28695  ORF Transcript_18717/g.28695 Transcript_18717/m.28695 type:complete len:87 (-) Transcript_18717:63-323(-)